MGFIDSQQNGIQYMATIVKNVEITNWITRIEVETIGEITPEMTLEVIPTVLNGRHCIIKTWIDDNGNGWEVNTITLREGEE